MVNCASSPAAIRRFPWWLPLGALLIPCLYLPTLFTRFDFSDDGVRAYPRPARSVFDRVDEVWQDTLHDFQTTGPFRPVTWAHLDVSAGLLGPNDFLRRAAHFGWSILAAGCLLWLLHELKVRPLAALLATMLSLWNPFRGEVWLGLSMTEAIGMPYALLGLICALRAARSSRPLAWDLAAILGLLAALGSKNTFAATIPAQLLLRLMAGGLSFRDGLLRYGWRASFHALPLLLPVIQFVALKLHPHPDQYATHFTWLQVSRWPRGLVRAMSLDVMLPGLLGAGLAVWLARRRAGGDSTSAGEEHEYRLPLLTGLLLLVFGTAIYLPINGVVGRYTIPAIWGADLWFAVLLSALGTVPSAFGRRLALGLVLTGLAAVAVFNLARQEKVAARNALLWQVLEFLEREAPPRTQIAWVGTTDDVSPSEELLLSEEFHFKNHLHSRGRVDLKVHWIPPEEEGRLTDWPPLILTGPLAPKTAGDCRLLREFETHYWAGQGSYRCFLWTQDAGATKQTALKSGSEKP